VIELWFTGLLQGETAAFRTETTRGHRPRRRPRGPRPAPGVTLKTASSRGNADNDASHVETPHVLGGQELRLPVCRLQAAELGNTETELQACRQLHNLAKQGTNTNIYRAVCAQVRVPRASHPCPHARSARSRRPRIG